MQDQADSSDSRSKAESEPLISRLRRRGALNELKALIATNAVESRSIRRDETRALNTAEKMRAETALAKGGYEPKAIRRILARAKTADPDKLSKYRETVLKRYSQVFGGLEPREHTSGDIIAFEQMQVALRKYRTCELRPKLRRMGLAYGFLLKKPYRAMEGRSYSPPPWINAQHAAERGANLIDLNFAEFLKVVADHSPHMTPFERGETIDRSSRRLVARRGYADGGGK